MSSFATPVKRGCGVRIQGGVYFESGLSHEGAALEEFLIDPPFRLPDELPLSPRGVQLFMRPDENGREVWHIMDWIGSEHYPNVADFLEEVRRFGLSRRLPRNLDFSKITIASRILLAHARAWVGNTTEYTRWSCPKHNVAHAPGELKAGECCAGVWWRDVEGGQAFDKVHDEVGARTQEKSMHIYGADSDLGGFSPIEYSTPDGDAHPLLVRRVMPSFEYFAHAPPDDVKPQYAPAFFASFACGRLAIVRGDDSEQSLEAARRAGVRVDEVDQ